MTYDLDGSPPSGPSSFAVLGDGSVVVADTMAVERGEPRLLHFDRTGRPRSVIDLAENEVASIVDVATDGSHLAILDVLVSVKRYRVLTFGLDGEVRSIVEVPEGLRLEDGLTGLVWDDSGVFLEFEFGARYARVGETGAIEAPATPVFGGTTVELIPLAGRATQVTTNQTFFAVERATDLGGVTLVGVAPDGSIVLVVDEVDVSGPAIAVTRRVQRYSADGQLSGEAIIDVANQFLDIPHALELGATGQVLYLFAQPDMVEIVVLDV